MKSYLKHFIITRDFVEYAYERWLKAEAGHKNEWRVQKEYDSKDVLIDEIYTEIKNRTVTFRPIHRYNHLEESNGKIRVLGVESVKQQILDYIVVLALDEFLNRRIGYWQISGIKNKGAVRYLRKVQGWTRNCKYHVHVDIKQFYPSTSKSLVYKVLLKYIKNEEILYIAKLLLNSYSFGLELGSYFSLCMANLVVSFCYHELEEKKNLKHQVWYMDDGYLFGDDPEELTALVNELSTYLFQNFHLELKAWKVYLNRRTYRSRTTKHSIFKGEPVDLAGYRITPTCITLRKNLFRRLLRSYRRFLKRGGERLARRCCSYWGYLKYTDSLGVRRRYNLDKIMKQCSALISALDKRRANEKQ